MSASLAAQQQKEKEQQQQKNNTIKVAATSPLFLQTSLDPTGFTPLLTPKSDALLQRKLSEASHQQIYNTTATTLRRDSYPISNLPPYAVPSTSAFKRPLVPSAISIKDYCDATSGFDKFKPLFPSDYDLSSSLHSTPERQSTSRDRSFSRDITKVEEEIPDILSDIEIDDKSEELAVNVVEKLFVGPGYSNEEPCSSTTSEEQFRSSSQQSTHPPSAKKIKFPRCSLEGKMEQLKEKSIKEDDVLDDWETADDNDITERMEKLLKDVAKTSKKKEKVTAMMNAASTPSTSNWDPNYLPNVLEIYGIPEYKMQEDVVRTLENIGYGDSNVKWIERKIVLVAFENPARAKAMLSMPRHDWLRVRALINSPKNVQDAARENEKRMFMGRKKLTNASVARRMVESQLGMRSNISQEQRLLERQQIADARKAKKNAVKWN
ncbi:unnamed protein product [Caenorhabditis angaria]|uniref:Uncharacterized protein n=1 Tax=Caenorhabditis angaria TaxID=860376 RepID=A0A9P1NBN6_9PELO|nr:unnamed protein product [Caenorhabditis angaria]